MNSAKGISKKKKKNLKTQNIKRKTQSNATLMSKMLVVELITTVGA